MIDCKTEDVSSHPSNVFIPASSTHKSKEFSQPWQNKCDQAIDTLPQVQQTAVSHGLVLGRCVGGLWEWVYS